MLTLLDRFGRRILIGIVLGLSAILLVGGIGAFLVRGDSARLAGGLHSTASPLEAYRGLGSWVDLYDTRAWKDPAAAVSDMASHGVRTVFVQTANSDSASGLLHPAALQTFITEAHKRHMYVVAWYLPNLRAGTLDYRRIVDAIDLKTGDGQTFDSFALDIESTVVKSQTARNQELAALSQQIRDRVGPAYALGAIIPSPVGLATEKAHWTDFPYAMLAKTYDVFLPMHYYTFDIHSPAQTYASTIDNMHVLRAQPGCASTPVHLIGGISDNSSTAQVQAFVRGVRETGCIGASLYGWAGTTMADWKALQQVR